MELNLDRQNDSLDATISIELGPDDYNEPLTESLKSYRQKVNLPGFRKGKVPLGMIKKMAGAELKQEKVQELVNEKIQSYLKEKEVNLLLNPLQSSPKPDEEVDWEKDNFEFKYDVGIRPKIDIDKSLLEKLPYYQIEVADDKVDEEIDYLRKQKGNFERVDKVEDSEQMNVNLKIVELNDDGEPLDGGVDTTKMIKLYDLPEDLKKELLGKESEHTFNINLKKAFEDTDELASFINADKNTVNDLGDEVRITLVVGFNFEEATLDQAFFDSIFGEGKVGSEEEFREEVKKAITDQQQRQASNYLYNQVRNELLENLNFDLPEGFLKKWHDAVNQEAEQEQESEYSDFEKDMKWLLIVDQFVDDMSIEIDPKEVLEYTKSMIANELLQSGMQDFDPEKLDQYALNYLQDQNNYNKTFYTLKEGKVFEQLKENVSFKEESIKLDEFKKLTEKENKDEK